MSGYIELEFANRFTSIKENTLSIVPPIGRSIRKQNARTANLPSMLHT